MTSLYQRQRRYPWETACTAAVSSPAVMMTGAHLSMHLRSRNYA